MQFLVVDAPGSEKPVSTMYQVGGAPVGDRVDTVFRVRNTSQTALVIRTLTLAGAAFSIFGQPSLPHTLAPGLNMDFTVRFSPRDYGSYSANLSVNGIGAAVDGLVDGRSRVVGRREPNCLPVPRLTLVWLSAARQLRRHSISRTRPLSGSSYKLPLSAASNSEWAQDLPLPIELAPHASVDFNVVFAPVASGVFEGSLVIDGRSFRLTAAAHEPPFPKPAILVDLPSPTSGQQGRVSVQFGQASRAIGTRQAQDGVSSLDNARARRRGRDASCEAIASNGFEVAEGATIPVSEMTFQTGTTAGTIVFIAEVGGWTATSSVDIGPEQVHIDKVRASKNGSMLEVEITGFDNTRTLNQLAFTFLTSEW